MFGAAGTLLNVSKRAQNQGKVRNILDHDSLTLYHVDFRLCFLLCSLYDTVWTHGTR